VIPDDTHGVDPEPMVYWYMGPGLRAEPLIGPRLARTRWRLAGMTGGHLTPGRIDP